jgi:hypothetical protein
MLQVLRRFVSSVFDHFVLKIETLNVSEMPVVP